MRDPNSYHDHPFLPVRREHGGEQLKELNGGLHFLFSHFSSWLLLWTLETNLRGCLESVLTFSFQNIPSHGFFPLFQLTLPL